jgi:hypothetical protein
MKIKVKLFGKFYTRTFHSEKDGYAAVAKYVARGIPVVVNPKPADRRERVL